MKPNLQLCTLCQDIAQQRDGNLILIGLFRNINCLSFPTVVENVLTVTMWVNGQGTFKEKIEIFGPDRELLLYESDPTEITLTEPTQSQIGMQPLKFSLEGEGIHWLRVVLDGQTIAEYPFNVRQTKPLPQEIKEGDLIKGLGPAVYRVDGGRKRHIPDPETFGRMGLKWHLIKIVPEEQLTEIPTGEPYPKL